MAVLFVIHNQNNNNNNHQHHHINNECNKKGDTLSMSRYEIIYYIAVSLSLCVCIVCNCTPASQTSGICLMNKAWNYKISPCFSFILFSLFCVASNASGWFTFILTRSQFFFLTRPRLKVHCCRFKYFILLYFHSWPVGDPAECIINIIHLHCMFFIIRLTSLSIRPCKEWLLSKEQSRAVLLRALNARES